MWNILRNFRIYGRFLPPWEQGVLYWGSSRILPPFRCLIIVSGLFLVSKGEKYFPLHSALAEESQKSISQELLQEKNSKPEKSSGQTVPVLPLMEDTPQVSAAPRSFDPLSLTAQELQILENLALRRKELKDEENKMRLRGSLLQASEQRIDKKIETLQTLKRNIDTLLTHYDEAQKKLGRHEQENFKALARIYEKMKPKEAARILSELEIGVSMRVMSHMKDMKTSQIISFMETNRARDITIALAKERTGLLSEKKP